MGIVFGCISPHPPIIVHEIGQGRESATQNTIDALRQVAEEMATHRPETAIIISPHGPLRPNAFGILAAERCSANLAEWGAPQVIFAFENDLDLVSLIRQECQEAGVPLEAIGRWHEGLDWGCTVPLYYLQHGLGTANLVPICISYLPPQQHFGLGVAVRRAVDRLGRRAVVIASADLSHALTHSAPNGYDPMGPLFDEKIQQAVAQWDVKAVLDMDAGFRQRAAEDAVPSLSFLMGAVFGLTVKARVLSYEGPFGVGYLVAAVDILTPEAETPREEARAAEPVAAAAATHPLVRLAKEAVEAFVLYGQAIEPTDVPAELREQAGVFVSIKKGSQLRGCIGTIEPTQASLAQEVVHNAIDSATSDPRFPPIAPEELAGLSYSVDVLSPPEPVTGPEELDPKRYGVVIRTGLRRGLLLPDIEGVSTVEEQIAIAKAKGGILQEEAAEIYRFTVQRYT
jgi:AmmeMemoRadiSam system protein A